MKKLLLYIIIGMFLLNFTSAFDWNDGNVTLYYNMSTTSVLDSLGRNNGVNSGTTAVSGHIGNALDFEASENDYINVSNLSGWITEQQGTFSFWMKPESFNATTQYIFEHNNNDDRFGFYLDGDVTGGNAGVGFIFMDNGGGLSAYNTTYNNGSWFHILATWNSTGTQLWVDGILRDTNTGNNIISFLDDEFYIGVTHLSESDRNYDGLLDEIGAWDRVLTTNEIEEIYNNHNGLTYGDGGDNQTISITLNQPNNESSVPISGMFFNATMNLTNPTNNYTWQNMTFNIFNPNGSIFNQSTITIPDLNITMVNLSIGNFTGLTTYTWNVNATYGNLTWANTTRSENRTFYTFITLNMLDSNNNHLSSVNINCPSANVNENSASPYRTSITTFTSLQSEEISCTFTDNNNYNNANTTTINFSTSISEYNISMNNKALTIYFYNYSDVLTNVTGFWYDENGTSGNFTNNTFVQILTNMTQGKIAVLWAFNDSAVNYTQYYEYDNDWITNTEVNMTLLELSDVLQYIKVVDDSNNPINDVLVSASMSKIDEGGMWKNIGQRFTGGDVANGMTSMYFDSDSFVTLRFSKDGYTTDTRYIDMNAQTYTFANPLTVVLRRGDFVVYRGAYVKVPPYYDLTQDYLSITIYAPARTEVTYTTNYRISQGLNNRTIILDDYDFACENMTRGEDYGNAEDLNITIWMDGVYWKNLIIDYDTSIDTSKYNEPSGLDSTTKTRLIWIGLIAICSLLGLLVKGNEESVGIGGYSKWFFMIGIIVVNLIFGIQFLMLLMITGLWLGMLLIKKWISE